MAEGQSTLAGVLQRTRQVFIAVLLLHVSPVSKMKRVNLWLNFRARAELQLTGSFPQVLAPKGNIIPSIEELSNLTPKSLLEQTKALHSSLCTAIGQEADPDASHSAHQVSLASNEFECLRVDLSHKFFDASEASVEQQADFRPPPADEFVLRWPVGRELQREVSGNLRVEWCVDRTNMKLRVWFKEVSSSHAAVCDF